MIEARIDTSVPALEGENVYTGWFLTYATHKQMLRDVLDTGGSGSTQTEPRLMFIRVGDKGAFKVSPVNGRLLGFELFGVRITGGDILREEAPEPTRSGALVIPLQNPYQPVVFEQGSGEVPCQEVGFRQIGYRVAAARTGHLFRVQFFRGGPAVSFFRIADCLTAGFGEGNVLAELWLENVRRTGQHG